MKKNTNLGGNPKIIPGLHCGFPAWPRGRSLLAALIFATWALGLGPKSRAQEPLPADTQNLSVESIMKNFTPEQRARIQQIAEQVARELKKKHGDNPDKIQAELQKYMADPSQFYRELSPSHKNAVEEIKKDVIRTQQP